MSITWAVERWLTQDDAAAIEYAGYWNDKGAERDKPWWVLDGDFAKLESYLDQTGLRGDLEHCLAALGRPLSGHGIDLAAGTLWAAPVLLDAGPVARLYCLEYSRHRLLDIGPTVLEHYAVDPQRVVLAFGSFYDLHVEDGSLDFAFLSQALHHADRPEELLSEIHRALAPGGVVIVIGEHLIRPRDYALYAAKVVASLAPERVQARAFGEPVRVHRRLRPRADDLFPPDPILGDHAYSDHDYDELFARHGFGVQRVRRRGSEFQGFLLRR